MVHLANEYIYFDRNVRQRFEIFEDKLVIWNVIKVEIKKVFGDTLRHLWLDTEELKLKKVESIYPNHTVFVKNY